MRWDEMRWRWASMQMRKADSQMLLGDRRGDGNGVGVWGIGTGRGRGVLMMIIFVFQLLHISPSCPSACVSLRSPPPPPPPPPPAATATDPPGGTGRGLLSYATEVIPPSPPSAFPPDLHPALTHLSTAFLPRNQHLATDPANSPFTHVISFPPAAHGRPQTDPATEEEDSEPAPENVIALASPFEGGDIYLTDAVQQLANQVDADIVRLDLVMGVALDGIAGPLGVCKCLLCLPLWTLG